MFNWIKNIFADDTATVTTSRTNTGETKMTARIQELPTNRFGLVAGGKLIGTYARRRDAVRGATRRGFTVA